MAERFFDDFRVGETFVSKAVTLHEAQILDFALKYDPQPFHIDTHTAADGPFGGLIASGFQTLALAFRMFYQEGVINACSLGSPGMEDLRWLAPVRPGDSIHTIVEVKETRPSRSKPDRGTAHMGCVVRNQNGEDVMSFTAIMIFKRRSTSG